MNFTLRRSLTLAACIGLIAAGTLSAETIIKTELGTIGPDVRYADGELFTVDDGNLNATSPGDRDTNARFVGFVGDAGIEDIAAGASFSLSGINAVGDAVTFGSLVNQSTTGGEFELYDPDGTILLSGVLDDGVLIGPSSESGVSTGSLFTVRFGTFTGPEDEDKDQIFKLLKPESAQLSMSFTNISDDSGKSGFSVLDGVLAGFTADVTAQIEAEASGNVQTPEPTSLGLAMFGALAFLGLRRRR